MSAKYLQTARQREARRGRNAVERMQRAAPRQLVLERLVWRDRVAEVLAVAEPADLAIACLLTDGLSLEQTARRLGMRPKSVYRRLERWRRRIAETQPGLAAWLGKTVR